MEVNSGGQVLFCFFAPAGTSAGHHQRAAQSVDLGNLHRSSIPSPLQSRKQTPSLPWLCRYLQLPINRSFTVCSVRSQGEPVPAVPTAFPVPVQVPSLAEALRALIIRPFGKEWQASALAKRGLSVLSFAGSCVAAGDAKEIPQEVATYYNPAYRPALEEELSSTDVKHAALSFRY